MSGRQKFKKYQIGIDVVAKLISCVPRVGQKFLWGIVDFSSGNVAALVRYSILRSQIKKIGENVYIGKRVTIKNCDRLTIGANVSLHEGLYLDAIGGCVIGDNVSIAHNVSIVTFNHSWSDLEVPIKYNKIVLGSVQISNDVWVGCGVRILAGASIESRSIIAAGSVVNKGLSCSGLYAGVPARKVKDLL